MMMPRKQVNVSLDPEVFDRVKMKADAEGIAVAAWCRDAVLDALERVEEVDDVAEDSLFPAWLLALLSVVRTRSRV